MNEHLPPREYEKINRTFMAFGSMMNAVQHIITPDNYLVISEYVWGMARKLVEELLDSKYDAQKSQTKDEWGDDMRPL